MTYLGFDVAKDNIVGVAMNDNCQTEEQFTFANNPFEIKTSLKRLSVKYGIVLAASEATADYHLPLVKECLKRQIPFKLLNPIITKQFTRATVRKKKTDLSDALIIAKLARQGEGTPISKASFSEGKIFGRTAIRLVKINQTLKLMRKRFTNVLPKERSMQKNLDKCIETIEIASSLFRQRSVNKTDSKVLSLLMSVPGMGQRTAATVINEVGDIKRFPSAKSLIAYAGLDPRVKQSGIALRHNTHITKRGSPFLRRDVFISAVIAARWDKDLNHYYQKKVNEGKRHKEAIVAVSRKLINRIYAVWQRQTPYIPSPI